MGELSDEEDNTRTRLPDGEVLDWAGLWLAEVYAPSHVPALEEGLEQLKLEKRSDLFGTRDAVRSVLQQRGGPGGFVNIGFFAKPGRFLAVGSALGIPPDFAFMQPTFFSVAPGVTVLIVQFALEDATRLELDSLLRRDFHATARPLRRGAYSMHHAGDLKEERIGEVRRRIRGAAENWLTDNLPGAYATRLNSDRPMWDLLLTSDEQLFSEDWSGPGDWRGTAGFGRVRDRWTANEIEGLHLLEPHGVKERNGAVYTFAGQRDQLVEGLGTGYGPEVHSLLQFLHGALGGLLSAWAFRSVLTAHERQFGNIRDELAAPTRGPLRAGRRLRRLQREVLPLAFDLETLERGSQDEWSLSLLGRHRETDFSGVPVRISEGRELPPPGDDLLTLQRDRIADEGRKVAESGRSVATAIRAQSEILLAATNVRLQWMVAGLTLLLGAAGVYATLQGS